MIPEGSAIQVTGPSVSNEGSAGARGRTKGSQLLVKSLITALLLTIVFRRVDLHAVLGLWQQLSLRSFVITVGMYGLAWAVASYKWKLLLPQHRWLDLLKLNFVGQYYSTIFPGQIAGEAVKAYRLSYGAPNAAQILASIIIDRITGLLGLLLLALGGIAFSIYRVDPRIILFLVLLTALLLVALFCINLDACFRLINVFSGRLAHFRPRIENLFNAWKHYMGQVGLLVWNVALGAFFQLIAILINVYFARQLGIRIGFAEWCWIFGVIAIVTMLPFTVGGIGLREGSFVGTLALVGVQPERALALSFAASILLFFGAAVGAVLDWMRPTSTGL